ncbi:porin family protein [Nostoc sp. CHAB 5834]|nr:porin family protein [Nostoc sp. CHAB 5834]
MKKLIAIAVLGLGLVGAASAQQFYGGVSVAAQSMQTSAAEQGLDNLERRGEGLKVTAGYDITPQVGFELAYQSANGSSAGVSGVNVGIDTRALSLAGIGKFQIAPKWDGTAKLGIARTTFDLGATASATDLVFGLGVSYALTKKVSIRTEWEQFRNFGGLDIPVNQVSVGTFYRF